MLRLLLKRMQLTYTLWVEALNTHNDGQGKTHRSCQKHEALSTCDVAFFLKKKKQTLIAIS